MNNMLGTLLLSQGTPMLTAGDEFGRTQQGNNNAYCQDNEISWVDWNHGDREERMIAFAKELIGLREKYAILRHRRFLSGVYNEMLGVKDVTWLAPNGEEMTVEQWEDPHGRCLGMLMDGRAQPTGIRRAGSDVTLLLIVNAHYDLVNFRLPAVPEGSHWMCLVDTNQTQGDCTAEHYPFDEDFGVTARSLLLFELVRNDAP